MRRDDVQIVSTEPIYDIHHRLSLSKITTYAHNPEIKQYLCSVLFQVAYHLG